MKRSCLLGIYSLKAIARHSYLLKQTSSLTFSAKLFEIPLTTPMDSPLRSVTQPTQRPIEPCRAKDGIKVGWWSVRPTSTPILKAALARKIGRPPLGETGQVDFASSKCGRLPIYWIDNVVPKKNILGIEFSVDDSWSRCQ